MASYFLADNAPLAGVAGSPREWVLIPAYSERPWKSPEKGAHPLLSHDVDNLISNLLIYLILVLILPG